MELPYANPKWDQYCVSSAPFRFFCWRFAESRILQYCVPAGTVSRPALWRNASRELGFLSDL